jgi:hypothetical protein
VDRLVGDATATASGGEAKRTDRSDGGERGRLRHRGDIHLEIVHVDGVGGAEVVVKDVIP